MKSYGADLEPTPDPTPHEIAAVSRERTAVRHDHRPYGDDRHAGVLLTPASVTSATSARTASFGRPAAHGRPSPPTSRHPPPPPPPPPPPTSMAGESQRWVATQRSERVPAPAAAAAWADAEGSPELVAAGRRRRWPEAFRALPLSLPTPMPPVPPVPMRADAGHAPGPRGRGMDLPHGHAAAAAASPPRSGVPGRDDPLVSTASTATTGPALSPEIGPPPLPAAGAVSPVAAGPPPANPLIRALLRSDFRPMTPLDPPPPPPAGARATTAMPSATEEPGCLARRSWRHLEMDALLPSAEAANGLMPSFAGLCQILRGEQACLLDAIGQLDRLIAALAQASASPGRAAAAAAAAVGSDGTPLEATAPAVGREQLDQATAAVQTAVREARVDVVEHCLFLQQQIEKASSDMVSAVQATQTRVAQLHETAAASEARHTAALAAACGSLMADLTATLPRLLQQASDAAAVARTPGPAAAVPTAAAAADEPTPVQTLLDRAVTQILQEIAALRDRLPHAVAPTASLATRGGAVATTDVSREMSGLPLTPPVHAPARVLAPPSALPRPLAIEAAPPPTAAVWDALTAIDQRVQHFQDETAQRSAAMADRFAGLMARLIDASEAQGAEARAQAALTTAMLERLAVAPPSRIAPASTRTSASLPPPPSDIDPTAAAAVPKATVPTRAVGTQCGLPARPKMRTRGTATPGEPRFTLNAVPATRAVAVATQSTQTAPDSPACQPAEPSASALAMLVAAAQRDIGVAAPIASAPSPSRDASADPSEAMTVPSPPPPPPGAGKGKRKRAKALTVTATATRSKQARRIDGPAAIKPSAAPVPVALAAAADQTVPSVPCRPPPSPQPTRTEALSRTLPEKTAAAGAAEHDVVYVLDGSSPAPMASQASVMDPTADAVPSPPLAARATMAPPTDLFTDPFF
ncbi:hypothetical protein CXG81DRAFT_27018 [Caulochytrium protostelioides]|uniref:Uncharacterized protein n=1 Tax=Caulochytrium protostelioides TaxID=1555241 RepID=A0A4P9X5H1_9FUNG|nr:hypothetical protein CXG81DRAFT_27018 [Caulochytrium protostelioides]|eukprot:RKP00260.1 hypothetical protein CXG81DRAFT_27018 [Caulochytrium protostelioides]